MIALGLWIAHIVDCINYLWSFALLQQDHEMTNHILACCGSWTSEPQTLHLLLKLATKSIRNPAAIRDTRKWNPIVVEQEVVIWQPGLNFYLTEYVMSVDYSITIFTLLLCPITECHITFIMTSSVKLFFGQPPPWSITICCGFLIQSYHLAWLSEWVPDCTDPILSCSNTLGMQFLVSWIALGLQWDFGLQKACGNIGPSEIVEMASRYIGYLL